MELRSNYEKELKRLHNEILLMSSMAEEMLRDAIGSLYNHDKALANEVIERDDLVDEKEVSIQKMINLLIATQQPVATDLRNVTSAFKITNNLERIADNAVNIAEVTKELKGQEYSEKEREFLENIKKMSELVIKLVRMTIDAYINLDISEEKDILTIENEVDHCQYDLYKDLIGEMIQDSDTVEKFSRFLFVASHLERVGDHAINVFEAVKYMVTGEYVDL